MNQGETRTRLRSGSAINAGEAVKAADDYFGQTVNIAARIAGASAPGEILVSEIVTKLVGGTNEFNFGASKLLEFKGVDNVQTAHPMEPPTEAANVEETAASIRTPQQ